MRAHRCPECGVIVPQASPSLIEFRNHMRFAHGIQEVEHEKCLKCGRGESLYNYKAHAIDVYENSGVFAAMAYAVGVVSMIVIIVFALQGNP